MLALRGAAAQASVVILPGFGATQTAIIQYPLSRASQAAVVEVTGPLTPEAEVVEVKVQEVALCASKGYEAALCVPSTKVVVVARRRVRRGAQKGGVLCLWASRNQVIILLGADDVVDVCSSWTGICLAYFWFLYVPPSVSHIRIRKTPKVIKPIQNCTFKTINSNHLGWCIYMLVKYLFESGFSRIVSSWQYFTCSRHQSDLSFVTWPCEESTQNSMHQAKLVTVWNIWGENKALSVPIISELFRLTLLNWSSQFLDLCQIVLFFQCGLYTVTFSVPLASLALVVIQHGLRKITT